MTAMNGRTRDDAPALTVMTSLAVPLVRPASGWPVRECAGCGRSFRMNNLRCESCRAVDRECVTCGKSFRGVRVECPQCRIPTRTCPGCGRTFRSNATRCASCRAVNRECVTCGKQITSTNRECQSCRVARHARDDWSAMVRQYNNTRRARKLAAEVSGPLPFTAYLDVIKSGPCVYCGAIAATVDHILPLSRGGHEILENLAPACQSCNSSKNDRLLTEWRPDRVDHAVAASLLVRAEYERQLSNHVEGNTMTSVINGNAREAAPPASLPPLAMPPVRQVEPALNWPPPGPDESITGIAKNAVDGDKVIRLLTAGVVLTVAAIAAVVSYSHIFALGRAHGQDGVAARLLPLSVDGLIAAASLVMLHAARNRITTRRLSLARIMLGLGVGATVAANVFYGLPFGWLGAVVSAWPAVAFVGSVEMAVKFVRDARAVAAGESPDIDSDGADEDDTEDDSNDDKKDDSDPPLPPPPDPPKPRQAKPSGRAKALAILKRSPALSDDVVAKRAGVSERTVQRARSELAKAEC
jgi:5-methylcytosine-specific restriction endonuclease McrA